MINHKDHIGHKEAVSLKVDLENWLRWDDFGLGGGGLERSGMANTSDYLD